MANEIVYLPCLDADGYFSGVKACQRDEAGSLLLPGDVVQASAPCAYPESDWAFYKWDGSKFVAEKKPTTTEECAAVGAIPHDSMTARCAELRSLFQTLTQGSLTHQLTRDDKLAWKVEAIPEQTESEKLAALAEEVRANRDNLIAKTDYLLTSDYPISAEDLAAVKVYRQALRDVPAQKGFPKTVTWPEQPDFLKEAE